MPVLGSGQPLQSEGFCSHHKLPFLVYYSLKPTSQHKSCWLQESHTILCTDGQWLHPTLLGHTWDVGKHSYIYCPYQQYKYLIGIVRLHCAAAFVIRITLSTKTFWLVKEVNFLILAWYIPWRIRGCYFFIPVASLFSTNAVNMHQAAKNPSSPLVIECYLLGTSVPATSGITLSTQQSSWTFIPLLIWTKPLSPWLNQPVFQKLRSCEAHFVMPAKQTTWGLSFLLKSPQCSVSFSWERLSC